MLLLSITVAMKNMKKDNSNSKFLSLILRHKPELIDVTMDVRGWVSVQELIDMAKSKKNIGLTMEELEGIVSNNDKQRFSFNDDKTKIRANQGHSLKWVQVELKDVTQTCPGILYHGTAEKNLDSIFHPNKGGIKKMNRTHVHLSNTVDTAKKVGSRHGKPVILEVLMRNLTRDGYRVYKSANGVYLTDDIPVGYFRKV